MNAIQMATINTAQHFGVARDIGMIAPGRFADILIVEDLPGFQIKQVFAQGQLVAQDGQSQVELPAYDYPDWVKSSIHLGRELIAEDFNLFLPPSEKPYPARVPANVIGVIENQATTRHLKMDVPVVDGQVQVDMSRDIAKIALVERHKGTGGVQIGLVQGFGFNVTCAIGTTVAHDSHHMIIVGTDEIDMAIAVAALAEMGGGQVVVLQGQVIGQVALPIAGLMSNERAEVVADQASSILAGFEACGCQLNNPNMQLSLLSLVVIPELRISDLGLVDVVKFGFVPVIDS